MFFKIEDILKIHNALLQLGVKDSELPNAEPVTYNDTLSIVQEGNNKQIGIKDFFNQISLWKKEDFINITDEYDKYNISLLEAINLVPTLQRKNGLVITFQDVEGNWEIYQFRGDITEFFEKDKWFDLYDYRNYIVQSIDLTASTPDENGNSLVSLKDRVQDPTSFSGKGYKILRKNIQSIPVAKIVLNINSLPSTDGNIIISIDNREINISLSINEETTIELVTQKIADFIKKQIREYEIIVTNGLITIIKINTNSIIPSSILSNNTGIVCTISSNIENKKYNILTQDMVKLPNTIYIVRYDFYIIGNLYIKKVQNFYMKEVVLKVI